MLKRLTIKRLWLLTLIGSLSVVAVIAHVAGITSLLNVNDGNVAKIGSTEYPTLVDAFNAANQSGNCTITLLADIDFSQSPYDAYKWAGSTYNPLEITSNNITIDLNGKTISNMGNTAIVLGHLLARDGRISNVTIKNGTLSAGQTDGVTNSYVLGIAGVDGALVENVTTTGGINVYTASTDVVIKDCNVTGTKYYTVCSQCGSEVTIKGTTYTKNTDNTVANKSMFWVQGAGTDSDLKTDANPTGAFGASTITIESGNFTVDTTNDGKFFLTGNGYVAPVVKGGTYNIDPSNTQSKDCVAPGYESVDNGDGTWTVETIKVAQIGNVKYETLKAAFAAVKDGETITLLADLDFSQAPYADYKWVGNTVNPLAITVDNVTLDLNNHTISNMGNCALGIGSIIAANGTVSGVTIKNGTLNAGTTNNVVNSYVLLLGGAKNATIQNVTTNGGINACAESNVYIKDCSVNGTKYYTVCAQTGANVTISGTTYTKNTDQTVQAKAMFWIQGAGTDSDMVTTENLTGAFDASTITIESGNFTVDTTNDGKFFLTGNGYVAPVVKGGTYNIDPSNIQKTDCVADGYEAVETTANTQWKVGEVVTGALTSTQATETSATYNVTAQVKDGDEVLETKTAQSVTVAIANNNIAEGAKLSDLNMQNVVAKAISEAPDNAETINVTIAVVASEPVVSGDTYTFEVHPEATVTVGSASSTVELTNADLAQNASFTFKLDVTGKFNNGTTIKVVHKSEGYEDETYYATVVDGMVTVSGITHFSNFELSAITPQDGMVAVNLTTGTQYATLQAAIDAAEDGQTIKLLKNCSGSGLFIGSSKFTSTGLAIDFGGFTYTVNTPVGSTGTVNQALHFESGNKITLTNGTIKVTDDPTALAGFEMFMQNYGTLIIDGMDLDGTGIAVVTYSDPKYQAYPEWYNTEKPQFNYNTAGSSVIRNSTITMPGALGIDDAAALTIEDDAVINVSAIATKGTDERYAGATATVTVENGAEFALTDPNNVSEFEALLNTKGQTLGTAVGGYYTVTTATTVADIILIDGEDYIFASDITVTNSITYRRSFESYRIGVYQPWFVPFDYTIKTADLEKFDFYKINVISNSKSEGGEAESSSTDVWVHIYPLAAGTVMHANKPYIIKAKKDAYVADTPYDFVSQKSGENLKLKGRATTYVHNLNSGMGDFWFYGTYEETHRSDINGIAGFTPEYFWYLDSEGKLSWGSTAFPYSLPSYRWYFILIAENNYAPSFGFIEDSSEATDLNGIEFAGDEEIEGFYTLNGVKVLTPSKGVYIVRYNNGMTKKINIK